MFSYLSLSNKTTTKQCHFLCKSETLKNYVKKDFIKRQNQINKLSDDIIPHNNNQPRASTDD